MTDESVDAAIREGWVRDGLVDADMYGATAARVTAYERSAYATGRASANVTADEAAAKFRAHVTPAPAREAVTPYVNPEGNTCTHHPDDPAHGPHCVYYPPKDQPTPSVASAPDSDEVGQCVREIERFLADAPKGKPHTGYRYGELLAQAAALLLREWEERDTFYMDYRMKCDEQTKVLYVRAEQAEARADALAAELAAARKALAAADAMRQTYDKPMKTYDNERLDIVVAYDAARAISKDGSAK